MGLQPADGEPVGAARRIRLPGLGRTGSALPPAVLLLGHRSPSTRARPPARARSRSRTAASGSPRATESARAPRTIWTNRR